MDYSNVKTIWLSSIFAHTLGYAGESCDKSYGLSLLSMQASYSMLSFMVSFRAVLRRVKHNMWLILLYAVEHLLYNHVIGPSCCSSLRASLNIAYSYTSVNHNNIRINISRETGLNLKPSKQHLHRYSTHLHQEGSFHKSQT